MRTRLSTLTGLVLVLGALGLPGSGVIAASDTNNAAASSAISGARVITYRAPRFTPSAQPSQVQSANPAAEPAESTAAPSEITATSANAAGNPLQIWTFDMRGSRDGRHHIGALVGHSPFAGVGVTDQIPAFIVPLFIRTHRIATSIDPKTLKLKTTPGAVTTDPTEADNRCLTAPNNVPVNLVRQSPVLTPTHFVFGGHDFGVTQYIDAFQRASFANVLGANVSNYHVLLAPVKTLDPIFIDVPENEGVAITEGGFFAHFNFSICPPLQLVDINWFDSYVQGTLLPRLAAQGVDPSNLPIFVSYEAAWPVADVTDLNNCCAVGYHNSV
jgi:hypothetical protein